MVVSSGLTVRWFKTLCTQWKCQTWLVNFWTFRNIKKHVFILFSPKGSKCSPDLFLIGDKYDLKDLVQFCEQELANSLGLENAIEFLCMAEKVNSKYLRDFAINFIGKNLKSFIDTQEWKDLNAREPDMTNKILKKHFGMDWKRGIISTTEEGGGGGLSRHVPYNIATPTIIP